MENLAWLLTGLAAVIGAIIGGAITGGVAYRIFQKQLLCTQYSIFAEDLQSAVKTHSTWKSIENDDEQKSKVKKDTELYLNRAWARALVTLPDDVFSEIDTMVRRGRVNVEMRNRLYHLLREKLYPSTSIKYDDIMTRNIELKE
jgi:hypothetical protein